MAEYQVIARKYRPQCFADVVGQEAIVRTLKNMIRTGRTAHAYLFCGSRGTGKTTLARLLAKALNCEALSSQQEPCNQCSNCREIAGGHSLDILEIDGASNRGIEDVRKINETVGYAAPSGRYKIYIIDEVHMLTKEAFNALLKTLEEPPPKVKFFFATTEPHKVLPTILSRCQRFNLNRIPSEQMVEALHRIALDLGLDVELDALRVIARIADGGLRDAESLLDQVVAFHDGKITIEAVSEVLGVMPRDILFRIDTAGKAGHLAEAFEITHEVFSQGKDLVHFVEALVEHFRNLLVVKLMGPSAPQLALSDSDRQGYTHSASLYTQEQCLNLLDYLMEAQQQVRYAPSSRIALESILLHIMRIHQRIPVEHLVKQMIELEQRLEGKTASSPADPAPQPPPAMIQAPKSTRPESKPIRSEPEPIAATSITEDPTPTPADLGKPQNLKETMKKQSRYDTVIQFAAVELGGSLKKH